MNTQNKVAKWSLIIGIVVVLNLFFNYALSLVYKEPEYNSFCKMEQVNEILTKDQCVAVGGQWNANTYYDKSVPTQTVAGYCDRDFTCRQDYESAKRNYDRNVFVTLVILGALSVLVGNFFKGNDVIASGLSMAGVLSFIIASMRYWSSANDAIRVVILAIALAILFWVAYKKFRNSNEGIRS